MENESIKVPVPTFPRHINSGKERHDLAVEWAQEETEQDVKSLETRYGRPVSAKGREFLTLNNLQIVRHSWADDRLRELETQLAGALKKIALLSKRLGVNNE